MNIKATLFVMVIVAQVLVACGANPLFAASTPTAVPTPTNDPLQSAKVVQAFWDALETGDLEAAMAYVADDAVCAGFCYFKGKERFRSYLQGYLTGGYSTKISDLRNVGSIVTYSWAVYRNGNFVRSGDNDEVMHIEDGKIIYWENLHR
jgi:limonene-1,2-epoxide hydrolase